MNQSPSPAEIPQCIAGANPVIVGGGPVGVFMASLFDVHNIPCTLIEREPLQLSVDISRTYVLGLYGRGVAAAKRIPAFIQAVQNISVPSTFNSSIMVNVDSSVVRRSAVQSTTDPIYLFLRHRLVNELRHYVQHTSVSVNFQTTVADVTYKPNGDIDVTMRSDDGKTNVITTRLLIACDGKNSVVRQSLHNAHNLPHISSAHGFDTVKWKIPSSGWRAKSIHFDQRVLDKFDLGDEWHRSGSVSICGKMLNVVMMPMQPDDVQECNGVIGLFCAPEKDPLWRLASTDEGYDLFQDNFPQLDIRAVISPQMMSKFVSTEPVVFPSVQRSSSLVAYVGQNGGVLIMGDAAHCFPPNAGQGLNSGYEDASILMKNILESGDGIALQDVLKQYDSTRDRSTDAMMRVMRESFPYAMPDQSLLAKIWRRRLFFRIMLSNGFSWALYPTMQQQLRSEMSFDEICRREDLSLLRIRLALATLVVIPVAGYIIATW